MSYNLLKGKKEALFFGALNEQSIAWKVAEKAVKKVQPSLYRIHRLLSVWAKCPLFRRN